jgi:two-component system LytT family response regulator
MPEMDGFEILHHLKDDLPLIIFVTAFDKYALKAFEVQALDYLLKPFDRKRFNLALERVLKINKRSYEREYEKKIYSLLKYVSNENEFPKKFVIRQSGKIFFVPVDEIDYLEAAGNYIKLVTSNGSYFMRETMSNMEKKIDPGKFIRIHRSLFVKAERIKELKPYFNGKYTITLKNGKELKSSKTYKNEINSFLLQE